MRYSAVIFPGREQWQQLGSAHREDGVRVHLLANAPCRETGPIEARLFRFVERFFDERTLAVGRLGRYLSWMTLAWNFLRMRTRRSGSNNPNIADARTYGNGGSSGSGGGGGGVDDQNIGIVDARQLLNYR